MAELLEIKGTMQIPEESAAHGVWIQRPLGALWHAVERFGVYIYGADGGGYDAIVTPHTMCKQAIPLGFAAMRNDRPQGGICPECDTEIEGAL